MTGFNLYCAVCGRSYFSKHQWSGHLIQELHQAKIIRTLNHWKEAERRTAIIVYCSGSLNFPRLVRSILDWFEETAGGSGTFVKDLFLSTNGKDKMCLVKLESRDKVTAVFTSLRGIPITIDNRRIELRRAETVLDIEWATLLESFLGPELYQPSLPATPIQHVPPEPLAVDPYSEFPFCMLNASSSPICLQFQEIFHSIVIPPGELRLVHKILSELKVILQMRFPNCELTLYRNNFLGFRNNPKSSTYLVYMTTPRGEILPPPEMPINLKGFLKNRFTNHNKNYAPIIRDLEWLELDEDFSMERCCTNLGMPFMHRPTGLRLALNRFRIGMTHFQLSRLLHYYLQFDPKLKPLLVLLYFWSRTNNIYLAKDNLESRDIPDTAGLEWMLLFYLYHTEKIIPEPWQILDRAHDSVFCEVQERGIHDIGFNYDLDFVEEWKQQRRNLNDRMSEAEDEDDGNNSEPVPMQLDEENDDEFIWKVVELFRRFCGFYSVAVPPRAVVDLRNGKILTLKKHEHQRKNCRICRRLFRERFLLIHPLGHVWKMPKDNLKWVRRIRPALKQTADRLARFKNGWNSSERGQDDDMVSSLKSALTLEEVVRMAVVRPRPRRPAQQRRNSS